jgi:hypothetical protein
MGFQDPIVNPDQGSRVHSAAWPRRGTQTKTHGKSGVPDLAHHASTVCVSTV